MYASVKKMATESLQLLGTKDDIIPPEDSIDMITGGNFIYRDDSWPEEVLLQ